MSTLPALVDGLVDDAAVFPPGSAPLPTAVAAHRRHRAAWYAGLVGPLLVGVTALPRLADLLGPEERIEVGVVGDVPLDQLDPDPGDGRIHVRQVEAAVGKRGEDPLPGLARLVELAGGPARSGRHHDGDRHRADGPTVYAELPLTFGLMGALDALATARADGVPVAAKFRTGGLAAELFPTPAELAAVICACRDREVPFKLTAGLHHAVRHLDPETGFTHHGFGNVLAATLAAAEGADLTAVADLLTMQDERPLVEWTLTRRDAARPLWIGFGSCSIEEPLTDLIRLGLVNGGVDA